MSQTWTCEGFCPKCEGEAVHQDGNMKLDGDYYYQTVECADCDLRFIQVYELRYVETQLED